MLMPSYIYTIKSWQFKEQFNPISIDINKQVCPWMSIYVCLSVSVYYTYVYIHKYMNIYYIYTHSIIFIYIYKFLEQKENGMGMNDCKKLHEEGEEVDIF